MGVGAVPRTSGVEGGCRDGCVCKASASSVADDADKFAMNPCSPRVSPPLGPAPLGDRMNCRGRRMLPGTGQKTGMPAT